MNLQNLIEIQGGLIEHIVKEKGLEGKDLVPDTFLSLQVEMSEFANEGRWFKYWSSNQMPRTKVLRTPTMMEEDKEYYNPLLEEFVDGVHLFLQIAILNHWEDALYIYEEQLDPDDFDEDLTAWYLEMTYFLNKSYFENPDEEFNEKWKSKFGFPAKQYWFRTAWVLFLNIGINGFGFTIEQIEQAYLEKNKINHERQINGY